MKKIKYIIATLFVVAVGAGIFWACEKEEKNKVDELNSKLIQKDNPIVNPFDEAGIVHNGCLDTIFDHEDFINSIMTEQQRFDIVQKYLNDHLQNNFVQISQNVYNDYYNAVVLRVNNRDFVSLIESLGENGILNTYYSNSYISRNNYDILYDFFEYMENMSFSSEQNAIELYDRICDVEQEVISNFYSLIDSNQLQITDAMYVEYKTTLMCCSVFEHSSFWWSLSPITQDRLSSRLDWQARMELQMIDFIAESEAWVNFVENPTQIATNASAKALIDSW